MKIPSQLRASLTALACGLSALLTLSNAQAELQDQGDGTVLDSATGLLWTQDANLFYTQYQADNAILEAIVSNAPSLDDPDGPRGKHEWKKDATLTEIYADFVNPNGSNSGPAVDGGMTWYGAMAWINWLNQQSYLGHQDWRLPQVKPLKDENFNFTEACDGSSDIGYNITASANELSNLFYAGLANQGLYKSAKDCSSADTNDPFGLTNSTPFENLKNNNYLTGTDYTDPNTAPGQVWGFFNSTGSTAIISKTQAWAYAIAVRGEAAPNPTGSVYSVENTATCEQLDKKARRFRLTLVAHNTGTKKRPVGQLAISVVRGEQSYTLKTRKVKIKPGNQKTIKLRWRNNGTGDVSFTATLGDTTATATCTAVTE